MPFTRETYHWGVSYNYRRFSIQSNWNYRGVTRKRTRPGNVDAGAYVWTPGLTFWDIHAQLRLTKNFTLYASVRNILEVAEIYSESYAPETPHDARFFQAFFYPRTWTVGVRAEF